MESVHRNLLVELKTAEIINNKTLVLGGAFFIPVSLALRGTTIPSAPLTSLADLQLISQQELFPPNSIHIIPHKAQLRPALKTTRKGCTSATTYFLSSYSFLLYLPPIFVYFLFLLILSPSY
jgi:hypothetical protein